MKDCIRIGQRPRIKQLTDRWGAPADVWEVTAWFWLTRGEWLMLQAYQKPFVSTQIEIQEFMFLAQGLSFSDPDWMQTDLYRRMDAAMRLFPTSVPTTLAQFKGFSGDCKDVVRQVAVFSCTDPDAVFRPWTTGDRLLAWYLRKVLAAFRRFLLWHS